MLDRGPMIPIDPGRTYTLEDFDRIREWGDRYEAMLDREYDVDGIPVTARREPSKFDGPCIVPPKRRRCLVWTPEGLVWGMM